MSMPFRIRPVNKHNGWTCNEDPKKLGDFYSRFLGLGGESLLSEETRWLAVTHKSYDQGKRGFNDRLSYMGEFLF
jgi:large subunit ribosomal protein L15